MSTTILNNIRDKGSPCLNSLFTKNMGQYDHLL